jgi:hypothetical protein
MREVIRLYIEVLRERGEDAPTPGGPDRDPAGGLTTR